MAKRSLLKLVPERQRRRRPERARLGSRGGRIAEPVGHLRARRVRDGASAAPERDGTQTRFAGSATRRARH